MRRRIARLALVIALLAATGLPGIPGIPVPRVAAAEYTLATAASYDVRPDDGEIAVSVQITFTNTTPDPAGKFSVFGELKLAVHDEATAVTASDAEGDLEVAVAVEGDVNVATVALREDLRFEETVEVELQYQLVDGNDPQLRIRPSLIVFPAWGFGTSSAVSVSIPAGYEVRTDGDALTDADGQLVSGPIGDPARWLALVTATRPAEYATFDATVPLTGGTADLSVRAFADDEAWGQRTRELVERALPQLEDAIGLPYPHVGALVVTESVATDASGFGEAGASGSEILVAFDEPPFTAVHQLAHIWISSTLVESRWIREGMASEIAARVAPELGVAPPFDPAAQATARAADAVPLDTWSTSSDPAVEAFAHASSWAFIGELNANVGADAMRTVLSRVASSVGPYAPAEIAGDPPASDGAAAPQAPLTSRSFLDQLETVSGADLGGRFAERVFTETDAALLGPRAAARAEFDELVATADGWGAPDPVRVAMAAWRFDDASALMREAASWLEERDSLLVEMKRVGLSAPPRLRQAYTSWGGGDEAHAELDRQRAVVESYAATAAEVNGSRSFLERAGLIGGPDPGGQLTVANGRFADGDLRGAAEAINEAQRILGSAETGGIVRLVSAGLIVVILAVLAVLLFRRRASYTAAA